MERKLIERIKNRDKDAFKGLYNNYAEYALRVAIAITKDNASALDVVQEVEGIKEERQVDLKESKLPGIYMEIEQIKDKNVQTMASELQAQLKSKYPNVKNMGNIINQ